MDEARQLRNLLQSEGIKVFTVVEKLEYIDSNHDGIIHVDDFIDAVGEMVHFSPRKLIKIADILQTGPRQGCVFYRNLPKLLDSLGEKHSNIENWQDNRCYPPEISHDRRGSVGEWLNKAACPSEKRNFKLLISALETFERESGLKLKASANGFVVPLGPDLQGTLEFNIRP